MNENKHTSHIIGLIGQAAEQTGQRRPMNPVISQLTQRPPKQFMADINQYMKEHSMLKQIHTAEYADTSRMKPDFSSVELQTLELCKEQKNNLFEDIIVAGTQQRSRSGQVARQLETSPLSNFTFNMHAYDAFKASIRLDYMHRHNMQYFRPFLNKELLAVILSLPFARIYLDHNYIQSYLQDRQKGITNNATLSALHEEVAKSGLFKYGLSNPQFKGLCQGFNSTSVDAAIIETVQSVRDTMKNSSYKEA